MAALAVRRRSVLWIAALVALASALTLVSFPTRQILAQRAATGAARQQISALNTENDRLAKRIQLLQDPDEIRTVAKERFDYVEPGEESYRVVLAASSTLPVPRAWPFLLPVEHG